MSIRPLQAQDIPRCASIMLQNPLWSRYGITDQSAAARLTQGFLQQASVYVSENQGMVNGFIWVVEKGAFNRSGYVMLIAVDPTYQNAGIGNQLMEFAEALLFQTCNDVFLLVSDFNLSAQRFYLRLGYAQVGAISDYVISGITELIFRKTKPHL